MVILGAGFAGLTAARDLVRGGRSVVALEARGRVQNKRIIGGEFSKRGGTFTGPTQNHIQASKRGRAGAVLNAFAGFFGDQARNPRSYFETNWPAAKWSRGGPVGSASPGMLIAYGRALREPFGRIHWAGTETSTFWMGYMDGAIRSGHRVAREVNARL